MSPPPPILPAPQPPAPRFLAACYYLRLPVFTSPCHFRWRFIRFILWHIHARSMPVSPFFSNRMSRMTRNEHIPLVKDKSPWRVWCANKWKKKSTASEECEVASAWVRWHLFCKKKKKKMEVQFFSHMQVPIVLQGFDLLVVARIWIAAEKLINEEATSTSSLLL